MVINADNVENLTFKMLMVDDTLHYSRGRWDMTHIRGELFIDGGRAYTRIGIDSSIPFTQMCYIIKDGIFINEDSLRCQ
jgi:hypothetical protein